jgi:hypothetical protein
VFVLFKILKVNINIKGVGLSFGKNNHNNNNNTLDNFISQTQLVGYQYIDELREPIKEKYILEHIEERRLQLNYVERIWKVVLFQIQNGFMSLKNKSGVTIDASTQHFDLALESCNNIILKYFRHIFEENGLSQMSITSVDNKNSEFSEYINMHQYSLKEIILKHIEKKCLFITDPKCRELVEYIKSNFSDEIDKATESSIIKAREISIQIKKSIKQKDAEIKELLTNSIQRTLKEKLLNVSNLPESNVNINKKKD